MQFAKDSFSVALRERLAALNPQRTVVVSGAERPAVVVLENELPSSGAQLSECFYLEWGPAQGLAKTQPQMPMYQMDCTIWYFTQGAAQSGVDRGRVLGELDREILMICNPPCTGKRDFSQSPSVDLGTGIWWTLPSMENPKIASDSPASGTERMTRIAKVTIFFFPEVGAL